MPRNPKTAASAASVADFIAAVPDERRRADCHQLIQLMHTATGEQPRMWGDSIVGFGTYLATYADSRTAPWPLIAFAPRKNDVTLYVVLDAAGQPPLLARLGKTTAGKGCLHVKRLADVDLAVLAGLLAGGVCARADQRVIAGAQA